MKKRQVMALILAAALALPNTGVVAEITGAPATVEAADKGTRAAGASIDFSSVTPVGTQSVSTVEKKLNDAVVAEVKKTETATTVGDVIEVGSGWKLLNGSDALKRGDNNTAKLRYTFAKETAVTGNGWEKDGDVYFAEFDIKFEAVEAIAPATVLESCKWPELTDKVFKGAGTNQTYWNDDLKSGSSAYGSFSVNTDAVSGAANNRTVTVTLTLNPGYEFTADTIDNQSVPDGGDTYTKDYKVNISKQVIEKFDWPEIKAKNDQKIEFNAVARDVLDLTFAQSKDGKINFSLVDKETKADIAANLKLKKGVNEFKIKAVPDDDTNYAIAEKDQYKDVSIDVSAPALKNVEVKKEGPKKDGTDDVKIGEGINGGTGGDAIVLKAIDTWSPEFADDAARDALYNMNYQWYKDGAKIEGATGGKYEVAATAPGQYYCDVSATFDKAASVENSEIYKDQPAISSQKVNVAFSDIAKGTVNKGAYNNSTYDNSSPEEYGELETDVVYTVPVTGISEKAEMTLVVKDSEGKDITDTVKSMISGKSGQIAANAGDFVITVNKNTDAGTYKFEVKVKDGSNTVTLTDTNLECKIIKREVPVTAAQIKPVNKDIVHGDSFDKLTGFEYTAAGETTDEKRAAKAINDKIKMTVNDWTNGDSQGFTNGYFETTTSTGKPVKVNVELTENYKKNYKLTTITTTADDLGTASVLVPVKEKEITLGIENLEIVKGEGLPKRTITGSDFLKADNIEVKELGWRLFREDDESQTEITNAVKSLKAGNYIVSVNLAVDGAKSANYKINGTKGTGATNSSDTRDVRAKLTIYESEHTVGFVTYGDTNIADAKVYHGQAIGTLPTPTRAGYKFIGWYSDRNCTTAYDAKAPVTSNIILYAKWEKVSGTNGGQNSADAVKAGTTTKTSAGTFAVINASTRTVAYKAASKSAKKVTVPSSVTIKGVSYKVTKIDNNAFKNCKKLTKVSIPSTVTEIGTAAFKGCKKLTSVTIPKNVNKIGKEAFSGCSKLKKVTIKSTKIKSVGKNAFKGIAKKSAIKTPKSKKAAYKKILKKSGYKKTVK